MPSNHEDLISVAESGDVVRLNELLKKPEKLKEVEENLGIQLLCIAAKHGRLRVLNRLLKIQNVLITAALHRNAALRAAAKNGHLAVLKSLLEIPSVDQMAGCDNNRPLCLAIKNNHLSTVVCLLKVPSVIVDIACADNLVLRSAAETGNLTILNCLLKIPAVLECVTAENNGALQAAASYKHWDLVVRLLRIPAVLAKANVDNNQVLCWAIEVKQQEMVEFLLGIPVILDTVAVDDNSILLWAAECGYWDAVARLLQIPAVLANANIQNNQALRWAVEDNNTLMVETLLKIPSVRAMAINLKQVPIDDEMRRIMLNPESSMEALRQENESCLARLRLHYEPQVKLCGVSAVLEGLYQALRERYQSAPQVIEVADKQVSLPVEWLDFQSLGLEGEVYKIACQAYYGHRIHTALRFLQEPNQWLKPNARFVVWQGEGAERIGSAQFEEEQLNLIALLWLVVIDDTVPFAGNWVEGLIDALAWLGRAHNWDGRREVAGLPGTYEDYDDQTGDDPSCPNGMTSRLIQVLTGHPLMEPIVSEEVLEGVLRGFVSKHFKQQLIARQDVPMIRKAFFKFCSQGDAKGSEVFSALNITKRAKKVFIKAAANSFGEEHRVFCTQYLEMRLKLEHEHTHLIQFGEEARVVLNEICPKQVRFSEDFVVLSPPPSPALVVERPPLHEMASPFKYDEISPPTKRARPEGHPV